MINDIKKVSVSENELKQIVERIGKQISLEGSELRRGNYQCCGTDCKFSRENNKVKNLLGQTFGELSVIGPINSYKSISNKTKISIAFEISSEVSVKYSLSCEVQAEYMSEMSLNLA